MGRTTLPLLGAILLLGHLVYGSKCPEQGSITRHVLCYYEGRTPVDNLNLCNCTHIILTNAVRVGSNYSLDLVEGVSHDLDIIRERKPSLTTIFTLSTGRNLEGSVFASANKSQQLLNGINEFLDRIDLNGVELDFPLTVSDALTKDQITLFVKTLKKTLENSSRARVKRSSYDVSESLQDDITTAPYRTPTAKSVRSSDKQTGRKSTAKRRKNSRTSRYGRRDLEEESTKETESERRSRRMRKELRDTRERSNSLVLVRVPVDPEVIAKKFDLKSLSKYADLLVVSTHNITDDSERRLTYHPSRLMGLSDMLNADSILDFLTGLGATKSKIALTLPATILKFQLEDSQKTTPRSPRFGEPETIDQSQLCSLFSNGNWTVERDDDLTAPYAFSDKVWLAYEDKISVNIKAKYILLRELAGGAIYPIDADRGHDPCNDTTGATGILTSALYKNLASLDRKPRGLVLESLQQDIHDTSYSTVEAGVHLSEYRIVRVVDHSGAVHVIRKNTKTQFECSRQGYFSHPLGCNKFYRCVKFNQYTDDFTVFEYDCPAGLAFDERWEVCVWPGSLPHGAPCTGSSEIAPVPRSHYQCPNQEGYYADPENCRWFFACLDHARDGVTPLTAYEFRCPFGLVFNEKNLACDWPWNVGGCGSAGFSGVIREHHGGSSSSLLTATFSAGGDATHHGSAGFQQFGGHQASGSSAFTGHAATGYIAGHFDDNQDRASFGTVPEHEISGGRILNHGGLILGQNVNLHGVGHGGRVATQKATPVVQTVQTGTVKANQFVYNPPLSSPRPFSVSVPEVHVNAEDHSTTFVAGSTTPRVETVVYGGKVAVDSGSSFGGSFGSEEYNHEFAGFGDKVTQGGSARSGQGQAAGGFNRVDLHLSTPSPISQVHTGSVHTIGFGQSSGVSATTAGYDQGRTVSIDRSKSLFQANTFGNVGTYRVSSTTETPTIFVTPQAKLHAYYESGAAHKASTGFGASNGTAFVHGSLSTPAPFSHDLNAAVQSAGGVGFGSKSAGNAILLEEHIEQVVIPKVLPTVTPSVAYEVPSVSVKPVTPKPALFEAAVTPAAVTIQHQDYVGSVQFSSPAPFSLRKEVVQQPVVSTPAPNVYKSSEYIPPVTVQQSIEYGPVVTTKVVQSTPAPTFFRRPGFSGRGGSFFKQTGQSSVISTPLSTYTAPEYLPPKPAVQHSVYTHSQGPTVQTNFVSAPVAVVPGKSELSSGAVTIEQGSGFKSSVQTIQQEPVVQDVNIVLPAVSTPATTVFKAAEYLPPVQGSVKTSSVHQRINVRPAVQTKFFQPVVTTQETTIVKQPEIVAVDQGRVDYKSTLQQNVQTFGQVPVVQNVDLVQPVVSTPAPTVFKAPEYLPPAQSGVSVSSVQQKVQHVRPAVETKIVQPVVSTPATAIFKQPSFVSTGVAVHQGRVDFKSVQPTVQTFAQTPIVQDVKLVQPAAPTPAPAVFQSAEYLPPADSKVEVSYQHDFQHIRPAVQTKVVQPVVSTPATAIFQGPQFVSSFGVNQGTDFKSSVQTVQQNPVVQDVNIVLPAVSTPATTVFKAAEYLPPVQGSVKTSSVHQRINVRPAVQTKFFQPVVTTQETTIVKQPEIVAVDQGRVDYKSTLQQNVQTFGQVPVVQNVDLVQPVVSTPAPAVFKAPEYLPPAQSGVSVSSVQQKVQHVRPVVETKVIQPVVSTPATTIFKQPEFVTPAITVNQGRVDFKSSVQENVQAFGAVPAVQKVDVVQPVVSTPAPAVFKAPAYLPPVQSNLPVSSIHQTIEHIRVRKPTKTTVYSGPDHVLLNSGVSVVKPALQTKLVKPAPATVVFKRPDLVASLEQERVDYNADVQPIVQAQVVSTPEPVIYKSEEFFAPVKTGAAISSAHEKFAQDVSFVQSGPALAKQNLNVAFHPSTTIAPVVYEQKQVQESVTYSPVNYNQEIYRSRPKAKQIVVQPQVDTYQQNIVFRKQLTTPAPTVSQVFGYQSTPRPEVYQVSNREEEFVVSQNVLEQSTPKPYVFEEYVEISSPKPAERIQQPIVVTEKTNTLHEVYLQPRKEQKTVYVESYERTNPVVASLEKEVVQVSSESPLVVNEESVDYYPPTGEEIENYSNFEFQKVGKASKGAAFQNVGVYTSGYQAQAVDNGGYRVNSNIEIAPPSEEYLLAVNPKVVTTTTAIPIQTTTYRPRVRPATTTEKYAEHERRRNKATIFTVGEVDKDEVDDDNVESLLEKYSGDFGGRDKFVTKVVTGEDRGEFVVGNEQDASTVGYEVTTTRSKSRGRYKSKYSADEEDGRSEDTTVASLDLKNLKIKKNKKTVIVVSQVSDANPLLVGKLAGQCSCQSNKVQLRKRVRVNGRTTTTTTSTTYLPPLDEVTSENVLDSVAIEAVTPQSSTENIIFIDGSRSAVKSRERKPDRALFVPADGQQRRRPSGRSRYNEIVGNDVGEALFTPVPADEIASKSGSKVAAGAAFDRYGPGGLRGFDETLQGSVDCERPGLFRHPKYCNKFYACNYDPWKKRYTLHVFNCPIHLSYDSSISACNWPSKGPACSDDHLLI